MTVMEFKVDAKGRLLLPASARAEAQFAPGSTVRGRVERGRITVETFETVQERVWSNAGTSEAPAQADQARHEAEVLASRERRVGGPEIDDVGAAALADLGL